MRMPPKPLAASLLLTLVVSACSADPCIKSAATNEVPTHWTTALPIAECTVNYHARQKTQLSSGAYDEASNTTFVAYPSGIADGLSACSPHIRAYDHATQTWGDEHIIAASPVEPDSHNYPQLLIADDGHLHVFHTMHGDHDVIYARSTAPRDASSWQTRPLEGTSKATYGAAFQSASGDMFLMYRNRDNRGSEDDYEPEYLLESSDGMATFTTRKVIDPNPSHPADAGGWGTIYTKAVNYVEGPVEGVQITFGVHKNHNIYLNAHYYAFLRLSDRHLLGPDGTDYGTELTPDEYADCLLFDHGGAQDFYNVRMAAGFDADGQPFVFHNQRVSGEQRLLVRRWDAGTGAWTSTDTGMRTVYPYEASVAADGSVVLYATQSRHQLLRYVFEGEAVTDTRVIAERPAGSDHKLEHLTFIQNARESELMGTFFRGPVSDWDSPSSWGTLFGFRL